MEHKSLISQSNVLTMILRKINCCCHRLKNWRLSTFSGKNKVRKELKSKIQLGLLTSLHKNLISLNWWIWLGYLRPDWLLVSKYIFVGFFFTWTLPEGNGFYFFYLIWLIVLWMVSCLTIFNRQCQWWIVIWYLFIQ